MAQQNMVLFLCKIPLVQTLARLNQATSVRKIRQGAKLARVSDSTRILFCDSLEYCIKEENQCAFKKRHVEELFILLQEK